MSQKIQIIEDEHQQGADGGVGPPDDCPNCGKWIESWWNYCGWCGTKLTNKEEGDGAV